MSVFEIITLSLSLILGLGIAQLLLNAVDIFKNRILWTWHWESFIWIFIIFILQLQFLFQLYWVNDYQKNWSNEVYSFTVVSTILLFLSGALILPNKTSKTKNNLNDYFEQNGRYAVLMIALYLINCVVINYFSGQVPWETANIFDYILSPLCILIFATKNGKIKLVGTLIIAVMTAIAFLTGIWGFT
ncbi:MAG TPA: hypothetical protein VJ945_00410 [Flavobacteriaceae bacterium]|nr:hypothetical protein [Flavobacteriaceae bacterium]